MDIVYLLKDTPTNEELTYSLRSLVNLPHDKVFFVGGCPNNIDRTKIIHIPIIQTNDKYKNTENGLKYICKDNRLSEDFILMNDDFFILKPIKDPKEELKLCRGPIEDVLKSLPSGGTYWLSMRQANIFLKDLGFSEPLSYELHIPMVINKKKFLDMFSLNYIDSISPGQQRSIYGNMFLKGSKFVKDVKVYQNKTESFEVDKFLSSEDTSWPRIKEYIGSLFSNKSEFEI